MGSERRKREFASSIVKSVGVPPDQQRSDASTRQANAKMAEVGLLRRTPTI
jgi:hypothetical protein